MTTTHHESPDVLRPLRVRAIVACLGWLSSMVLLLGQHYLRVLHPLSLLFIFLLVVTFGAALGGFLRGVWRVFRGPQRGRAYLWTLLAVTPVFLWLQVGAYAFSQWGRRQTPNNTLFTLGKLAGASLMEAQARFLFPHRLETDHFVMFYTDSVTDPQCDADIMDNHVARMIEETGLPLRAKIYWVRGSLLGQRYLAMYGLALGSEASPAHALDRHELAHAILYQHYIPDTDPPTLLSEGWAEAQSVDGPVLAQRAGQERHGLNEHGRQARRKVGPALSPLQTLFHADWYHQDSGPVYSVGGAFTDFLLRRAGAACFVEFYFACRPGYVETEFQRVYEEGLTTVEKEFWEDVHHRIVAVPLPQVP